MPVLEPSGFFSQQMANALMGLGKEAWNLAQIPGKVYQSTPENPVTTGELIKPAADMAMLLAGGGAPAAETGAAGIFGGRLARTADRSALKKALEAHYGANAPKEEILQSTGWFPDPSGRMKFEIDDSAAKINPDWLEVGPEKNPYVPTAGLRLKDFFDHPELYDAYPGAAKIRLTRETNNENAGSYNPITDIIKVQSGRGGEDTRQTLLHELQHAIQTREGFAKGANKTNFYPPGYPELKSKLANQSKSLVSFLRGQTENAPDLIYNLNNFILGNPYDQAKIQDVIDVMHKTNMVEPFRNLIQAHRLASKEFEIPAHMQYRMTPGELEAKNVEYRSDFSPLERIINPPWSTQDQIVRALMGNQR